MNIFKKIIFLFAITAVGFSCNDDNHSDTNRSPKKSFLSSLKKLGIKNNDSTSTIFIAYGSVFASLMKNDQGIFRGLHFGMNPENVKKSEEMKPDEDDKDYLFYTIPFDTIAADSNNYYTISYSFDERGMSEIKAEVFFNTNQDAAQLVKKLEDFYEKKYQQPITENEASIWTVRDPNYGKIKIAMSDESYEYGYGKITLSFYNADY
ncbi:MAG: hypothetical protein ABI199_02790 [Bacteroidia bacterium]